MKNFTNPFKSGVGFSVSSEWVRERVSEGIRFASACRCFPWCFTCFLHGSWCQLDGERENVFIIDITFGIKFAFQSNSHFSWKNYHGTKFFHIASERSTAAFSAASDIREWLKACESLLWLQSFVGTGQKKKENASSESTRSLFFALCFCTQLKQH